MKKCLILLIALLLCACTSELEKQGYNEEEIVAIEKLSEDSQMIFLNEHIENVLPILNNSSFIEKNLDQYIQYYGQMEDDLLFEYINDGTLKKYDIDKIKKVQEDPYYIEKYFEKYMEYYDEFDNVRDLVEFINVQRYDAYYTNAKPTDMSKGYLILVNKYNYLESDYVPEDLVEIESTYGAGYLRKEMYDAYVKLYWDAYEVGYDLRAVSPYRGYDTQYRLYHYYLENDSQENVDTYSARPGHSEHQSGLCLDVSVPGYSIDDFYLTDACDWLNDNCYKYGFIIRYPKGKEDITGYQWEPWQIRYVGKEAEKIYQSGITFDEYYAYYIENE